MYSSALRKTTLVALQPKGNTEITVEGNYEVYGLLQLHSRLYVIHQLD